MMTSREADLSSKDLNYILPSYLINEVQSIKSDQEEKQSQVYDEIRLFNIPIFNQEKESKTETSFINSPNSYQSLESFKNSPKTDSNDLLNYNNSINQIKSVDAENELQDSNNNNDNSNFNNILSNNICCFLNMNNGNQIVFNNFNSNDLIYTNNYFSNNFCNDIFDSNNNQNFCNFGLNKNNPNFNSDQNYLNKHIQQELYYHNKKMNYNINDDYYVNKLNMKICNFKVEEEKLNHLYENNYNLFSNNKMKLNIYPEGNIIKNYFNGINNINNIQDKLAENQNYSYNFQNIINSSLKEDNKIKNTIINKVQNQNKNLDEFMNYLYSLPIPLVDFLCTPKGTSEIQKILEKSDNKYRILLVNLLRRQGLSKIMTNTYGNYFFQQLIKKNEKSFISLILSYIKEDLIYISKDFQRTFCLQALLDEVSSFEDEQTILNIIKNYEIEMAFDKNATHVLQKIILLFPDNHRMYLNEIILNNFISLSLDSNGICLIKIFMKTNTLISNKERINEKVINNFVILAESPFGNYGVQYLMEIWNEDDLKDVKNKILENIYELSLQQFSSNVIEKAIETFSQKNREEILRKLCFEEKFIVSLINNKFGKFVLNKAIKFMRLDMINELESKINNDINNNLFKSKDKNKIKKILTKLKNCRKKEIFPKRYE